MPRQITLVGIDPKTYSSASEFGRYLQHSENREQLSFALREDGYDARGGSEDSSRPGLDLAGWRWRRMMAPYWKQQAEEEIRISQETAPSELGADPFSQAQSLDGAQDVQALDEVAEFDPAKEQHPGAVLGIALSAYLDRDGAEQFLLVPGEDVRIGYPTTGARPEIKQARFTVVDFYESKMSEYDSGFVFVPLPVLQNLLRHVRPADRRRSRVGDPDQAARGRRLATMVRDQTPPQRGVRPRIVMSISTWMDKQGPLLAAVQMETTILNILLFLIIAVAGFGILAIFYMIVVEKTRDIGVLKALGALGVRRDEHLPQLRSIAGRGRRGRRLGCWG